MSFGDDTLDPSSSSMAKIIDTLRIIRDKGWQYNRCHYFYSEIETMAREALKELGIEDGPPYPNPRPYGWWNR
jgi:hypothetical protein